MAVRDGAPKPDTATPGAFKQALPRELQKVTVYSAALPTRGTITEPAKAFVEFMTRPAFKARLAAAGLDYKD